ncbi:hypothetical protein ACQ4PT_068709 [Festuca glaucescens]
MVCSFLLLLLLMPLSAIATPTAELCGSGGNYKANSTYQSNLAVLATTLANDANSSPKLFATASTGQSPDAVYVLALCGSNFANDTACGLCVAASFQDAQQACPYRRAAAVYYEYDNPQRPGCLVGFSGDEGFLSPAGGVTESVLFESWNPNTISGNGDASVVTADVHKLLTVTAQDAAADDASRYATTVMDAATTLYSLAQCTPDLSAGDCLACLQRLIGMLNTTTCVRQGGRILVLRCNIRFEAFKFFDQPTRRISPSSITPAPSGKSMCTNSDEKSI